MAGNVGDLIVVDSVAVGNSTALYAQPNGTLTVSNATLSGNGKVRQIDALGMMYSYGDNRTAIAPSNASPGDPYTSSLSRD